MPIQLSAVCDFCRTRSEPYEIPDAGPFGGGAPRAGIPSGWRIFDITGADKVLPPSADPLSEHLPGGPGGQFLGAYLSLLTRPVQVNLVCCNQCWDQGKILQPTAQEVIEGAISEAMGEQRREAMGQMLSFPGTGQVYTGAEEDADLVRDADLDRRAELEAQIAELDAQLAAVGVGPVPPLAPGIEET